MSTLIPGSLALYAPGNFTPVGLAEPPPVTVSCYLNLLEMFFPYELINDTYVAGHVELRASSLGSSVQSDGLGTQEIVAGGDVGGDRDVLLAAVLVQEVVAPDLGGRVVAELEYLEPGGRAVGGGGVVHLAQVHHDGAEVVAAEGFAGAVPIAGLLVHLDGDDVAGYEEIRECRYRSWGVVVLPATLHLEAAALEPALQRMSLVLTLVTGLLLPLLDVSS